MTISSTLNKFLDQQQIEFKLVPHTPTSSSMETVRQAHVPGNRLAKAVILKDQNNYSMVVLPSVEHVDLGVLRKQLGHSVELATESDLNNLFPDCAVGAIPPVGRAWGLDTYLDDSFLGDGDEVFFEAGDHEDLVRISGDQFQKLLGDVKHGHYGHTI